MSEAAAVEPTAAWDGVASRRELMAAGLSYDAIEAQLAARRWRRLNEAVVVLHNGPLTADQRRLAVWLSAQSPAALASVTAATRLGLRGHDDDVVHVLVVRGGRVLPTPGISRRVHESRRFDAEDIWLDQRPAYVSLERAVIDAAAWSRHYIDVARLLCDAVQQRLTTPELLREELEPVGKVQHRALMSRLLVDLGGGAQAVSEVEFLKFCRRHRLPTPRMNVRLDSRGRRRYLDAKLVGPTGRVAFIEVDGGVHLTLRQRWQDHRNDNRSALDGQLTLRYPSVAIYADDEQVVAEIREAIGISQQQPGS